MSNEKNWSMEHTPTPWEYKGPSEDNVVQEIFYTAEDGKKMVVARTYDWGEFPRQPRAIGNAVLIVKACNNYEALVKALRTIANRLRNEPHYVQAGMVGIAEAALEAAGEL